MKLLFAQIAGLSDRAIAENEIMIAYNYKNMATKELAKPIETYIPPPKMFINTSTSRITSNKHLLEWPQHRKYCIYTLQIWHN